MSLAKSGYFVIAGLCSPERKRLLLEAAIRARVAEKIDCHQLDVTIPEQVNETVAYVQQRYSTVDVLIHNAGIAIDLPAEAAEAGQSQPQTPAEAQALFEAVFAGATQMTRAMLPILRNQHGGQILLLSPLGRESRMSAMRSHLQSQCAAEGWTEQMRLQVRSLGMEVLLVEPGAVTSNVRHWSEEKANAQQVADQIVRAIRPPNPKLRYITGKDAHTLLLLRRILSLATLEKLIVGSQKVEKR
jgi:NAD(P)-dependent dehydrogenase (short-subunit alcohol dehydrogenase family)